LFHLVNSSPWPVITAIGIFFFVSGLGFYMHRIMNGFFFFLLGVIILILCAYFWFTDIIYEATSEGFHTRVVRVGLKNGFYLFLVSEFMLFFGFFWAFFSFFYMPGYRNW